MSMPKSKSKSKKHKNKSKKPRSGGRTAEEALRRKIEKNYPGLQIVNGPPQDGVKMSEVLEEFIKPYMGSIESDEVFRRLVTVAAAVWNMMLLSEVERVPHLQKLLQTFPEEIRDDGRGIVKGMMERKERLFTQYRRVILGFEVENSGVGWHLSVTSSPLKA